MKLSSKSYPSTDSPKGEDHWQAESDLRTLMDAEKIRADKGRFNAAIAKRDEQRGHLSAIRRPRAG